MGKKMITPLTALLFIYSFIHSFMYFIHSFFIKDYLLE